MIQTGHGDVVSDVNQRKGIPTGCSFLKWRTAYSWVPPWPRFPWTTRNPAEDHVKQHFLPLNTYLGQGIRGKDRAKYPNGNRGHAVNDTVHRSDGEGPRENGSIMLHTGREPKNLGG